MRLEALGDNKIMGSRFLEAVLLDGIFAEVFLRRPRKYCFAASETLVKSVGFVPRRMVRRDVIVRSLEWMRRTVAERPFTDTEDFLTEEGSSPSVVVVVDLSSTNDLSKNKWNTKERSQTNVI